MAKKEVNNKLLIASTLAGVAATVAVMHGSKKYKNKREEQEINKNNKLIDISEKVNGNKHAYFIGGGLASLAGATYLIRDCNFKGENIHIIEGMPILGGSNDGAGDVQSGFVCRGGRMLNEETYENFWELFSSIPSIEDNRRSVTEEILNFDHLHPTHAQARLIDRNGAIQDVTSMGFNTKDRSLLGKLMATPENKLDNITIEEWFKESPHFFETNFWYMWQTTFAFQKLFKSFSA